MTHSPIRLQLGSDSSKGEVTMLVEILSDGIQFADVEEIKNKLVVNLYPSPDNRPFEVSYEDFVKALEAAKEMLELK